MKAKEIAERETEDLLTLEKELRRQLFEYRLKNNTNSLDDTSLARKTRRDIARVKTVLAQRAKSTGAKR